MGQAILVTAELADFVYIPARLHRSLNYQG